MKHDISLIIDNLKEVYQEKGNNISLINQKFNINEDDSDRQQELL
jgi:hypothetical protein